MNTAKHPIVRRVSAARVRYRAIWGRDMSPAAAEGEKPAE